jgi:hypothetical protein
MTDAVRRRGRINWTNLVTVASACVLVGAMILALGFATGWAVAGVFGVGEIGTRIIEAVFVGVAIVGVVAFWRSATRVEPVIER